MAGWLQDGLELANPKLLSGSGAAKLSSPGVAKEAYNVWEEWRAQIKASFEVEHDDDDEGAGEKEGGKDGSGKTWFTLVLHYITFTWRIMLSVIVPPAEWKGGYPCFTGAMAAVIGIVYLVHEAGRLFGCMVGLKEIVTGISIIAIGKRLILLGNTCAPLIVTDADVRIACYVICDMSYVVYAHRHVRIRARTHACKIVHVCVCVCVRVRVCVCARARARARACVSATAPCRVPRAGCLPQS